MNTASHQALADVLALLDPEVFGAVYDPGNAFFNAMEEMPYPDGYYAVRPYLAHVHVKDVVFDASVPRCVAPGEGLTGWPRLLRKLQEDGYQGWLSLETHYRKGAVLTPEQMRMPAGSEFSRGGMEATRESAEALLELLRTAE